MIVLLGDTHRQTGHGLAGELLDRVRTATAVVHTGDFVTEAVVDSFETTANGRFVGVHGNADAGSVRSRLPERQTVTVDGRTIVVVHGHDHTPSLLSFMGREAGADLVAFGHSHRPVIEEGPVTLCNPGSHTSPRGGPPTYALIDESRCRILTTDGSLEGEHSLA